jgi:S-DNA-T family DNA segregation ATPase FtsK/SpoIIIE
VDQCDECGFVYEDLASTAVPGTIRTLADQYAGLLLAPQHARGVGARPSPDVWSALEYTCHVRDVVLIQRDRVLLALVEDTPSYPPMYRDERVTLAGYQQESTEEVVRELGVASNLIAKLFDGLSPEQLERRCIYNFPSPTERTVAWLGRHTVHEAKHHLDDVRSGFERIAL